MAPDLLIPAIRPRDTDWRARVLVLEKGNITITKNNKRLQKMVLMDNEGNRVLGVLWDASTDLFRNSLSLFKTYCIGGATVSPIKDEYLKNNPGMTLQWIIGRSTYICPSKDTEETIPYPNVPYVSCTKMITSVGTEQRIDLFAVIMDVKTPQEKPVHGKPTLLQECTIMQQELRPITLTLWGNFINVQGMELLEKKDKYPILLARNLIASTFTGLALATTPASFIAIDPEIPQAMDFRTWVSNHMTVIKNTETNPTRETFQSLLAYSPNEPIVRIADIIPDTKHQWVKIQMMIDRTSQQLTHTACPKCMYAITAKPEENYYCFTCNNNQIAKLSCKLNTTIADASETIKAAMFDSVAEDLLKRTAKELHSMTAKETQELLQSTNTQLQDRAFHVQLRAQRKKFDDNITRYTIQQVHFSSVNEHTEQNKPHPPAQTLEEGNTVCPETARNKLDVDKAQPTASTSAEHIPDKHITPKTKDSSTGTSDAPISPLKKLKVNDV